MIYFKLVDASNNHHSYGILGVNGKKVGSIYDVQDKINEIKNEFIENGYEDWEIDDVLDELPSEWEVTILPVYDDELVEI